MAQPIRTLSVLNGLYQPLISLSKSKYFAYLLALVFLFVFNQVVSQEFPKKWTGHYVGKINITNIRNTHSSIKVTLDIRALTPDSIWSYRMCYFSSQDTMIKDYQIVKINENRYVMDEGLIEIPMYYANGMPGIHHVMARAIKDIFCRDKTLKGFQVKRIAGWDTYGLPVQLGVEKELGITKEDIGEKITIEAYSKA